jgi:molybdopterin synthase sulfur carrier subunit
MRIHVKGYLTLREVSGDLSLSENQADGISVRELLGQLSQSLGDESVQIDPSPAGEGTDQHLIVLVNGRHCSHLPDGLDTKLKDGDEVALFPPVAGG